MHKGGLKRVRTEAACGAQPKASTERVSTEAKRALFKPTAWTKFPEKAKDSGMDGSTTGTHGETQRRAASAPSGKAALIFWTHSGQSSCEACHDLEGAIAPDTEVTYPKDHFIALRAVPVDSVMDTAGPAQQGQPL